MRPMPPRWVGALLHFMQDAGCPPHAANLRGDVHSKMETWVEAERIQIADYPFRPWEPRRKKYSRNFREGSTESYPRLRHADAACALPWKSGTAGAVRPVILESALECAQLTADLLRALGPSASPQLPAEPCVVPCPAVPQSEWSAFRPKVILEGTDFSTLCDLTGKFEFRNLPASNYTVIAYRLGNGMVRKVAVKAGQANMWDGLSGIDPKLGTQRRLQAWLGCAQTLRIIGLKPRAVGTASRSY